MMRLEQDNTVKIFNIETNIIKCKDLKHQIQILEAEYEKTKQKLITEHFHFFDEFIGREGLTMATYKEQMRTQFMQTEFKKDHIKLYEEYSVKIPMKVFLIKK
jgi:hypothetical protein